MERKVHRYEGREFKRSIVLSGILVAGVKTKSMVVNI
jgi:hypothetical protein